MSDGHSDWIGDDAGDDQAPRLRLELLDAKKEVLFWKKQALSAQASIRAMIEDKGEDHG